MFVFLMVDVGISVELRGGGELRGEGELSGEGKGVVRLFVSVDRLIGWWLSKTVSESEFLSE